MNLENFKKVRDLIQDLPARNFNMNTYGTVDLEKDGSHCGTVMCIAGHTCTLIDDTEIVPDGRGVLSFYKDGKNRYPWDLARKFLGLTVIESNHIFYGRWASGHDLYAITKEETIEYLDKVIASGNVYG